MKIYIAGKITGRPKRDYYTQFMEKAMDLRARGHKVLNPAALNEPLADQGFRYDDMMHVCMAYIDIADAVYMLDGWEQSPGARKEHLKALESGKRVIYETAERKRYEKRIKAGN